MKCNCGEKLAGYVVIEEDAGDYVCMHVADFANPHVFAECRRDALIWKVGGYVPEHDVLDINGVVLLVGECRVEE